MNLNLATLQGYINIISFFISKKNIIKKKIILPYTKIQFNIKPFYIKIFFKLQKVLAYVE